MTIILVATTANEVVQVADRRLTFPNGRLFDDRTNKSLAVKLFDSQFAVSFTGLAHLDGVRTDRWLVTAISEGSGSAKHLFELVEMVRIRLGEAVRSTRLPVHLRGVTVVCSGFHFGQIFICSISNQNIDEGTKRITIREEFNVETRFRHNPVWATDLFVFGETRAMEDTFDRRLRKFRKESFRADGLEVAAQLVVFARSAKRHPKFGHVIGRGCSSIAVNIGQGFQVAYFPTKTTRIADFPHFVGKGFAVHDVVAQSLNDEFPHIQIITKGIGVEEGFQGDIEWKMTITE